MQIVPPTMAVSAASNAYNSAIQQLQSPVELPFAVIADGARTDIQRAVDLLAPHTDGADMFLSRNASQSIDAANEAIELLDALADPSTIANFPLQLVVDKVRHAEQVLWYE